jgi:hypothetical protein
MHAFKSGLVKRDAVRLTARRARNSFNSINMIYNKLVFAAICQFAVPFILSILIAVN